ncbi:TPA: hypothetical protein ACH3X1_009945 [Trebouxia sp. C0004]
MVGLTNGAFRLSNADKQQAAIKLTEKLLGALLQQHDQGVFVHVVQGVPVTSLSPLRRLNTSFSPVPACSLTCRVHSVRFRGKQGLGGGRYVFFHEMTQIAKRGPGHVVSVTTVESPLSSPITLELHMCWNRLYRTLATPGPEELVVTGANQVPKETGSGHDTWLTYAGLSQDFGNDCLVQVCRLYPTLDGVRQVDKLKAQDQQLAIRAPVYGDMHQQEISNAIAQSRPTIQKVRQASQSKILHELTVNRYSVKDNLGNDILQTALEEKLQSAGACAASAASTALHPISTLPPHCQRQHPGPTVQALQDIQILPSTIVGISPTHQRPSSDSGLSTASESSTQSVWTRLGELAEYMTIKNRHFEKHLLKVESHVEDHDADILELNLNNLDLDKRWSHSGKEARSPSPGEEMLSCVRDPEDMDEGMPDYSPSQEAVLSPLDTCPAAHAAPESTIGNKYTIYSHGGSI